MEIIRLKEIDSTQLFLKDYTLKNGFKNPLCVVTDIQTQGIGSRGNSWIGEEGNLFFSFVLSKDSLPEDLPIQSSSIYFSFILKKVLNNNGSKVWLKWPNDFYIENKKIGGTITNVNSSLIFCGIGLNINFVSKEFGKLDIKIDKMAILKEYFSLLDKKLLWKQIFSDFKIEFYKSQEFSTTIDSEKHSLFLATLNDDGSIQVNNKKVFSLR